VRLWDMATSRHLREVARHRDHTGRRLHGSKEFTYCIVGVAAKGTAIVSAGADGSVQVHDRDGKLLRRFDLNSPHEIETRFGWDILAMALTPGGQNIAAWSQRGSNSNSRFDWC